LNSVHRSVYHFYYIGTLEYLYYFYYYLNASTGVEFRWETDILYRVHHCFEKIRSNETTGKKLLSFFFSYLERERKKEGERERERERDFDSGRERFDRENY
jgi:hypothetical protein